MASGPVYSVTFLGTTKNYYVDVSADAGENLRQFGELVEDFTPHLTVRLAVSSSAVLIIAQLPSHMASKDTSKSCRL